MKSRFERRVIHQTAGKGVVQPIQSEGFGNRGGQRFQIAMDQQMGHAGRGPMLQDQSIAGKEVAVFGLCQSKQIPVRLSGDGQTGVVTGGAQITGQPAEHLVAEKTGWQGARPHTQIRSPLFLRMRVEKSTSLPRQASPSKVRMSSALARTSSRLLPWTMAKRL